MNTLLPVRAKNKKKSEWGLFPHHIRPVRYKGHSFTEVHDMIFYIGSFNVSNLLMYSI